ncbi:MAG: heme ABC transporter ATP-binding protein [Candidatus Eiseniibacteriota bacterium]
MIETDCVTFRVGASALVDDATIAVRPGEVLALLGPNGAGKSTLLRLLSGDATPSAGAVRMAGRPLAAWTRHEAARVRAVLPQSSTLEFAFTAFEVALMGRFPHDGRGESRACRAIAEAALDETGAWPLRDRLYPTLSGGEQQRVQLARVLAQIWEPPADGAPRYLLLDEPTSSLDLAHQHETLAVARRLAGQGVGVVAVLHDLNLAALYADRVALMAGGRLGTPGTPKAVFSAEAIERVFGVPVTVGRHPDGRHPLVIAAPRLA